MENGRNPEEFRVAIPIYFEGNSFGLARVVEFYFVVATGATWPSLPLPLSVSPELWPESKSWTIRRAVLEGLRAEGEAAAVAVD